MEISLIRHGKSLCKESNRISIVELKGWIENYNGEGVFEKNAYPSTTMDSIARANIVLTSDLKRSVDSANLLNPKTKSFSTSLFRETELPTVSRKLGNLKLYPSIWAMILRFLWLSGYSAGCESLTCAKIRAEKASELLIEYAKVNKSVVLVGYGFFNMLIAKELQKKGWEGKKRTSSEHWSCTTYSY